MDIYWCNWREGDPTPKAPDITLTAQVLGLLEQNPNGSFAEMDINQLDKWRPYDRARALEVLGHGRTPSLGLRTGTNPQAFASLAVGPGLLVATLDVPNGALQEVSVSQALLAYIRQIARVLPLFSYAYATAAYVGEALTHQHQLPLLADFLGLTLHWYYLLAPQTFAATYTREALLGAPAYAVREWENGWIEMLSYEDPLSYADPATQQRIVALTRYLDEQRRDRPQASTP